jgi:hypothetical protein
MNNSQNARFYFANLSADVARCISACENNDENRFINSLLRARNTLEFLHNTNRHEAFEEGLLLLRALIFARDKGELIKFQNNLNELTVQYAPTL